MLDSDGMLLGLSEACGWRWVPMLDTASKAVRKALRDVAMAHGGLDEDRATEWLRRLEAEKRLQCETW